jgi:protocatechuate 3,4-dioxygenase beta subunit
MASSPSSPADAGLPNPSRRRQLLGTVLGGLGAVTLQACGSGPRRPAASDVREEELATAATCSVVPTETEGPFPLRAAMATEALVRADITEGKTGVPLTLRIRLVDVNNRCKPIAGAWVYVWHCDRDGQYSGYDGMATGQAGSTWLRGIQRSDADGIVTFTTLYPGWYEGRITHVHCMVFLAGSGLSSASPSMATTQFAFPEAVTAAVYASPLYGKGPNTSVQRIEDDGVFADGAATEMLALSGSVQAGYVGGIVVGVDQAVSNAVGGGFGGPPGGWPPGGMPSGGMPPRGWGAPPRGGPPRGRGGPG